MHLLYDTDCFFMTFTHLTAIISLLCMHISPVFTSNPLASHVFNPLGWWCCRGAEEKAASMCGHREMVVAMTTVTVMVTPQACGQSPSTQPSMMDAPPSMMRAAPPPWHPRSATDARGTQRLEWWVCALCMYVYVCWYTIHRTFCVCYLIKKIYFIHLL